MFGRKKDDAPKTKATKTAAAKAPDKPAAQPQTKPLPQTRAAPALSLRKPTPARPFTAATSRIADIPGMMPPRSEVRPYGVEGKTLVVGREISLAGQIDACDKLVVEGTVEAELGACRTLDIAPGGIFKGSAEIEESEISGRFEGSLTVKKRLKVRSSGRIHGTVTYGQLEIEVGGEISGDIKVLSQENETESGAPRAVEAGE